MAKSKVIPPPQFQDTEDVDIEAVIKQLQTLLPNDGGSIRSSMPIVYGSEIANQINNRIYEGNKAAERGNIVSDILFKELNRPERLQTALREGVKGGLGGADVGGVFVPDTFPSPGFTAPMRDYEAMPEIEMQQISVSKRAPGGSGGNKKLLKAVAMNYNSSTRQMQIVDHQQQRTGFDGYSNLPPSQLYEISQRLLGEYADEDKLKTQFRHNGKYGWYGVESEIVDAMKDANANELYNRTGGVFSIKNGEIALDWANLMQTQGSGDNKLYKHKVIYFREAIANGVPTRVKMEKDIWLPGIYGINDNPNMARIIGEVATYGDDVEIVRSIPESKYKDAFQAIKLMTNFIAKNNRAFYDKFGPYYDKLQDYENRNHAEQQGKEAWQHRLLNWFLNGKR